MATHHTCDRCGRDAKAGSDYIGGDVNLPKWIGDGSIPPRDQLVQVTLKLRAPNLEDSADFCVLCQIDCALGLVDQLRAWDKARREANHAP